MLSGAGVAVPRVAVAAAERLRPPTAPGHPVHVLDGVHGAARQDGLRQQPPAVSTLRLR
jgi:hypothetical protein